MSPKAFRDPPVTGGEGGTRREDPAGRGATRAAATQGGASGGGRAVSRRQRRESAHSASPITLGQLGLGLLLCVGVAILTAHFAERRIQASTVTAVPLGGAGPVSGRGPRLRTGGNPTRTRSTSSASESGSVTANIPSSSGTMTTHPEPERARAASSPSASNRTSEGAIADIGFVAEAHGPQVRACYDRAFRHDPAAPSGRIDLSFELIESGEFGRAVQIRSELNLLGSTVVESCLIELLSEWSFPRPRPLPPGVAPPRLRYPFVFSAAP